MRLHLSGVCRTFSAGERIQPRCSLMQSTESAGCHDPEDFNGNDFWTHPGVPPYPIRRVIPGVLLVFSIPHPRTVNQRYHGFRPDPCGIRVPYMYSSHLQQFWAVLALPAKMQDIPLPLIRWYPDRQSLWVPRRGRGSFAGIYNPRGYLCSLISWYCPPGSGWKTGMSGASGCSECLL